MGRGIREIGICNLLVVDVLKSCMENQGIKQSYILEKTNIPKASLSKILSGKMQISIDILFEICKAINIRPSVVMNEVESSLKRKTDNNTPELDLAYKKTDYDPWDETEGWGEQP